MLGMSISFTTDKTEYQEKEQHWTWLEFHWFLYKKYVEVKYSTIFSGSINIYYSSDISHISTFWDVCFVEFELRVVLRDHYQILNVKEI